MRAQIGMWLLVLAAATLNAPSLGEEVRNDATAAQRLQDRAVASAFALPKGVTLNSKQQAAYDELKQAQEGELRQAIAAKSAKAIRDCRAKIRAGIQEILAMPNSEKKAGQSQGQSASQYGPEYGSSAPYQPNYYPNSYPNYPRYYGYPYSYYYHKPIATTSRPTTTSQSTTNSRPTTKRTTPLKSTTTSKIKQ
jgi:hypothetical protein